MTLACYHDRAREVVHEHAHDGIHEHARDGIHEHTPDGNYGIANMWMIDAILDEATLKPC